MDSDNGLAQIENGCSKTLKLRMLRKWRRFGEREHPSLYRPSNLDLRVLSTAVLPPFLSPDQIPSPYLSSVE